MRSISGALVLQLFVFLLSATLTFSHETDQEKDPRRVLQQCMQRCQQQPYESRRICERFCEEEYGGEKVNDESRKERKKEKEEEEEGSRNPYIFKKEGFRYIFKTEHGYARALKKFHEQSQLLLGIANWRVVVLEAEPNTFVMPSHWDGDAIFYVVKGKGTITRITGEERRETHGVRRGDILGVCAGDVVYMVNGDSSERLVISMLINPVSTPGEIEGFFGPGGQDPESFYSSFSDEVLEAAFNAPKEKLQRLFGRHKKGVIFRASEEQIRALSHGGGGGGGSIIPPFGPRHSNPINLFDRRPTHSSRHGKLFEVGADEYEPLKHLNLKISFANITRGSMTAPFYNTRATKVVVVTGGKGWTEIICPHLSERKRRGHGGEEEEEERSRRGERISYERVRADVSPGDVFVVPPGHPTAEVASSEEGLQLLCFDIRAENNARNYLAGRNSVMRQLESAAKELSFDLPSKEVEELFDAQKESTLIQGPSERRREGGGDEDERRRHQPLQSIVDFAGGLF